MKAAFRLAWLPGLLLLCSFPLSALSVTGTVVGSDAPTVGLADATIVLDGALDYTATTNAQGQFTIADVAGNAAYAYTVTRADYNPATGTLTVGSVNYNMGYIILNELTYPPTNVLALPNEPNVALNWTASIGPVPAYKVWRLQPGQEQEEWNWTLLTPSPILPTTYSDTGWAMLPDGFYRWAVKAVFTNNVLSEAAFSNVLQKPAQIVWPPENVVAVETPPYATVTWSLTGPELRPFLGCRVWRILAGQENNEATWNILTPGTVNDTFYVDQGWPSLPAGIYKWGVRSIYSDYYQSIPVFSNALEKVVGNPDPNNPPTVTGLVNCSPNPFSSATDISYTVKDRSGIRLEIYNSKGQKVKTLIDAMEAAGVHQVNWNGTDDNQQKVAGGIYFLQMNDGRNTSVRKLLLIR
jgi:hypothetical protein